MAERELTTLEYIVLGTISITPQSGYSIVNLFDDEAYSWSASPGSVYPMLKRLEKQGLIESTLEMEHETRPRKMYHLTEAGGKLLDVWLHEVPSMRPFYQQTEIALLRFQFMEHRLSKQDIIKWLDSYIDAITYSDYATKLYQQGIIAAMEEGHFSLHAQLLMEGHIMELNRLRTWLELARGRISITAYQTGEFQTIEAIDPDKKTEKQSN